jgi:hypothetical protein
MLFNPIQSVLKRLNQTFPILVKNVSPSRATRSLPFARPDQNHALLTEGLTNLGEAVSPVGAEKPYDPGDSVIVSSISPSAARPLIRYPCLRAPRS